jgi:hypothetical protein
MSWFKKKKELNDIKTDTSILPDQRKCKHIWWDSDPFFEFSWNVYQNESNRKKNKKEQLGRLRIKIIESYVCCNCGERHNESLQETEIEDITRDQALEEIHKTKEEYKDFCRPRAKVEDEINDLIYKIDRNLLQTLAIYQPYKVGSVINSNVQVPTLEKFLKGE